jgi:hypothetical protein
MYTTARDEIPAIPATTKNIRKGISDKTSKNMPKSGTTEVVRISLDTPGGSRTLDTSLATTYDNRSTTGVGEGLCLCPKTCRYIHGVACRYLCCEAEAVTGLKSHTTDHQFLQPFCRLLHTSSHLSDMLDLGLHICCI